MASSNTICRIGVFYDGSFFAYAADAKTMGIMDESDVVELTAARDRRRGGSRQ